MDSAPQDVFSLVQQALDHALRPLERRLASLEGHNTSMPVGNLESGQEHDSRIVDGTCTPETDPLLIPVASQSADSSLGAGHTCMALLRHHQSCTTKVGISPDHHGYCAWRHWRHGGNLKSATTKKLVAKHKSGSATFAALSLLDLLDLGKISFSSLVMKWTADQEQLLLSLYFEVKTRHHDT